MKPLFWISYIFLVFVLFNEEDIEYKGEMVINLWGGFQDEQKTLEWNEDTLVNVFSVTKGITAICVLMLIDKGQIDINNVMVIKALKDTLNRVFHKMWHRRAISV